MAAFTLEEILEATNGEAKQIELGSTFSDVSTDTRFIPEGGLYVALRGDHFDGHHFVQEAILGGAKAVLVEEEIDASIPCIIVKNTLKAYQDLARFHRRRFSIPVVAVTGSSGKTTTKEMIGDVLSEQFVVLRTEKNFNNEIGLPKTLLQLTDEHQVCVVEMGMRGLGQIAELAAIAEPTIGVVTNVGTSHMELLGSQEEIAKAKGELIAALPKDAYAILNEDDPYVRAMNQLGEHRIVSYGIDHPSMVQAVQIKAKRDGQKFTCLCYGRDFDIFLPMVGRHNVYDALAAIAVARVLGVDSTKMNRALSHFTGTPMRQELIDLGDIILVNDAYNANPSSMKEAILAVGQLEGKRKVAFLGDMLELGEQSASMHEEIGIVLGEEKYALLFAFGKDAEYIIKGALSAGVSKAVLTSSHEEMAALYEQERMPGDIVLIKGSRGMRMEDAIPFLINKKE